METIKRIPRPMGTTELGRKYNITKSDEDKQELRNHFIRSYIQNNFKYNGKAMSTEQFQIIAQCTNQEIMIQLVQSGKESPIKWEEFNTTEQGINLIREISSRAFFGVLESQSRIGSQTELLLRSQGDSYKPWISAEVAKMLKLGIEQTQLLMQFAKQLSPTSQGQIIPYSPYTEVPQGTITIDDVTQAFKDHNVTPLIESPEKIKALEQLYHIEDLPEVNALLQYDYDASKEGLTLNKLTDIPIEEDLPKHINRRAKELNIDLSQDQM